MQTSLESNPPPPSHASRAFWYFYALSFIIILVFPQQVGCVTVACWLRDGSLQDKGNAKRCASFKVLCVVENMKRAASSLQT